jgi:hypothetical protein
MTYLPDLCPYGGGADASHLAVGWIDREHPFSTGALPEDAWIRRLLHVAAHRKLRPFPQFHYSPFLPAHALPVVLWKRRGSYPVTENAASLILGEIVVRHLNQTLHAPALIVHYILNQNYLPPPEFILGVNAAVSDEDLVDFEARLSFYDVPARKPADLDS